MIAIRIDTVDFLRKTAIVTVLRDGVPWFSRTISNPNIEVPAAWQSAVETHFENNVKPALITRLEAERDENYDKLSKLDPDNYPSA